MHMCCTVVVSAARLHVHLLTKQTYSVRCWVSKPLWHRGARENEKGGKRPWESHFGWFRMRTLPQIPVYKRQRGAYSYAFHVIFIIF